MGGNDTPLKSEQEVQQNQRSTHRTPAPVLGLRTASYCTENEGTPSVSYKTLLDPEDLAAAMVDGALPKGITPHVASLLDEAPLSLIVAAVEEAAMKSSLPPKLLWKHLLHWAKELQSPRSVWA